MYETTLTARLQLRVNEGLESGRNSTHPLLTFLPTVTHIINAFFVNKTYLEKV